VCGFNFNGLPLYNEPNDLTRMVDEIYFKTNHSRELEFYFLMKQLLTILYTIRKSLVILIL